MKYPGRIIFGFGIVLFLALLGFYLIGSPRPILIPVPDENAYSYYLEASTLLPNQFPSYNDRDFDKTGVVEFVSKSGDAYQLVDDGLEKVCVVPVKATKGWWTQHGTEVTQLKRMTHAMLARAELLERSGETDAAFDLCIDAFRFAAAIGHGGVELDFLNSISCRALVLGHVKPMVPTLSAEQRRRFITVIEECGPLMEEPTTVSKRTDEWAQAIFGWHRRWLLLRKAFETRSLEPLGNIYQRQLEEHKEIYDQLEKTMSDTLQSKVDLVASYTEQSAAPNGGSASRQQSDTTDDSPSVRQVLAS